MKKTQKEIEPNSVFIREPFTCWDSKLKTGFVWPEVVFFTTWNIAEIDNPAVNELLNLHNIRVDEEFLHVFYDILFPFTGLRWLTKHQMCVIFDEAFQDSAPWEKYQPYHISLSVGAKRAILGKYWQKELSKTLVRVRHRMIPAPLTLFSNRIR